MIYIFSGMVVMFYLFLFPVWPITYIGWYVGGSIIGINFAKYGLAVVMFVVGYYLFLRITRMGKKLYTFSFIAIEYLILDAVTTYMKADKYELVAFTIVKKFITWGVSNA